MTDQQIKKDRSWLEHREDGIDWALFWNGGRVLDEAGEPVPRKVVGRVEAVLSEITTWPDVDLFVRPDQGRTRRPER